MRKPALKNFLLSSFLALAFYLLFTVLPVNAQTQSPYSAPINNPDVPQNLHTYSQNVMLEVMSAMICQLSGVDPIQKDHQCLGVDPFNQRIGYVQGGVSGGALGSMSNLIGYTFQLPVSSGQYFNYLASNFGITKPSFAYRNATTTTTQPPNVTMTMAGTGFEGLRPLLKIWAALRDLVYVLFVLGFVIVGVAVMLRIKIDPRTVMTLQNRIPKIIAGLVLVTFSYAIAGFLIDFMWATIYLIINLFANINPANTQQNIQVLYNLKDGGSLNSGNVFNYAKSTMGIANVAWDASRGVGDIVASMLDNEAGQWISHFFASAIGVSVGTGLGKLAGSIAKAVGSSVPGIGAIVGIASGLISTAVSNAYADTITKQVSGIVVFLVLLISLLSALFRLWFKLLVAFILIVLGVVLAPLWIFAGVLPGNKLGFGSWIRHMMSQVIIFPMTVAMFALGKVVIDGYNMAGALNTGFVPPLLGYGADQASISSLLAIGLIFITPNIAKWAGEIFKGPKLDVTPIGQAVKAGTGSLTEGGKTLGSYFHTPKALGTRQGMSGVFSRFIR